MPLEKYISCGQPYRSNGEAALNSQPSSKKRRQLEAGGGGERLRKRGEGRPGRPDHGQGSQQECHGTGRSLRPDLGEAKTKTAA